MPRSLPWTPTPRHAKPTSSALAAARISKKIQSHQPGAQRWHALYGEQLLCVRYRDDPDNGRRVVTVELLVEERPLPARPPRRDEPVMVQIRYGETRLAAQARAYGGRWDAKARFWSMTRDQATQAGLADRIQTPK